MTELRKIYDLIADLKADGYMVVLLENYVNEFLLHISKCKLLHDKGYSFVTTRDYENSGECLTFIRGFLWGVEMYNFISKDRIEACIDELISAYDFD